jgi:hypothetical protein
LINTEKMIEARSMQKRPLTASYIFFYLLFSDDTWRILAGFIVAVWVGPMVTQGRNLSQGGEVMVWLMMMAIGWSISGWPARKITSALKKAVKKTAG